jgi:hypothetical protein
MNVIGRLEGGAENRLRGLKSRAEASALARF